MASQEGEKERERENGEREKEEEEEEEEEEVGFEEMGLDPRLLRTLAKRGLSSPTPIQLKAIPLILEGKDVVGRAKTGSGKTLAYLLPLLHKLLVSKGGEFSGAPTGPTALVLVPTRELCQQVHSEAASLLELCGGGWKAVQLISNMSASSLKAALSGPPDIIVTTPACLAFCMTKQILKPNTLSESLSTLVLDEADLLLSYGYEDDLRNLAPHVPRKCQCLLMSATSSADVEKLKKLVLHNPVTLTLMDTESKSSEGVVPKSVQQFQISCKAEDKLLHILALLHLDLVQKKVLVFVNSIDTSFRLKLFLEQFGVKSVLLNAELPQNSRLHILQEFNLGLFDYLIATDDVKGHDSVPEQKSNSNKKRVNKQSTADSEFGVVRGIDFKNVRTVINFDMPLTPAGYIHRIGRTGRAHSTGAAVSLVSSEEESLLRNVEEMLDGDSSNPGSVKHMLPFPSLTQNAVESLRYRAEDVARGVTKVAIREAKAKDLRMEILNSERLKTHFEDNPKDLDLLKHDKVLTKSQCLPYLKSVPDYLKDPTAETASNSIKLARAAMGTGRNVSGYLSRQRRKRTKTDDPLKTFSASSKKQKREKSGGMLWNHKKGLPSSKQHQKKKKKHRRTK